MRPLSYSTRAQRFVDTLPREAAARILHATGSLRAVPWPPGAKKLLGKEPLYRIRVGAYRILYSVNAERILIHRTDKRSRAYQR